MNVNVALNGCGRVGKALIEHWLRLDQMPNVVMIRRSDRQWRNDNGISREDLVRFLRNGHFPNDPIEDLNNVLQDCPIDVWFELTPTDLSQAETVHRQMLRIIESGVSIVFANKAPVVHDYIGLKRPADVAGVKLGLSGVMGASLPGFALGYYGAMGSTIVEMAGILNATTNFLLEEMEQGCNFQQAIDKAIELGIAEPKWSYDVDGIDSGVKMAILAGVVFDRNIALDQSNVRGIRDITSEQIRQKLVQGKRYKLVARYKDGQVRVGPEEFAADDMFYLITGSQKILSIKTEELSNMSVFNDRTGLAEVAAGLHRDLVWIKHELNG